MWLSRAILAFLGLCAGVAGVPDEARAEPLPQRRVLGVVDSQPRALQRLPSDQVLTWAGELQTQGSPRSQLNPKFDGVSTEALKAAQADDGLTGPSVLLAVGAPLSVVASSLTVWAVIAWGPGSAFSGNRGDAQCICPFVTWPLIGATVSGIGLGVWGSFLLGARMKAQSELSREIELREQIHRYRQPVANNGLLLTHGPIGVPLGLGWGMHGTF